MRPHPEERAFARVSKDGSESAPCIRPSRRRAEPVIGPAFGRTRWHGSSGGGPKSFPGSFAGTTQMRAALRPPTRMTAFTVTRVTRNFPAFGHGVEQETEAAPARFKSAEP